MAVALTYLPVALRLGITVGDSSDDPDADPDTIWCDEGKVTLKPRIKDAVAKETDVSVLLGQAELTGMIRSDGWVVWDHALATVVTGVPCIKVVDLTSDAIQPYITSGATHDFTIVGAKARGTKVEFSRGNQPVRLSPAQIDPTIGVINLADQVVASPPTIVQVVTGPKGDQGDTGATGPQGPPGGVNKVAGLQGEPTAQQLVDAIADPLSAQEVKNLTDPGAVRDAADKRVKATAFGVTEKIACIGDSFTAGNQDGTGTTYPNMLALALPWASVTNLGKPGWTSTEIAALWGVPFTLNAFTVPAGAGQANQVTVDVLWPVETYRTDAELFPSWLGELRPPNADPIPGRLRHQIDSGATPRNKWTFERTDGGTAVNVPSGTQFVCTENDSLKDATLIIGIGRNNVWAPVVVRDVNAILTQHKKANPRFLVLSIPTWQNETAGTNAYRTVMGVNAALKAAFPNEYVDYRRTVIDRGLALTSLTPTLNDTSQQALDTIPPQLTVADGHGTNKLYRIMADTIRLALSRVGAVIKPRGTVNGINSSAIGPMIWDAEDIGGPDGTVVTDWADRIDGKLFQQGTSANRPTLVTVGNRRYVRFDGTDDWLAATFALPQPFTVIAKFRIRNRGTKQHGLAWSQGSPGATFVVMSNGALKMDAGLTSAADSVVALTDVVAGATFDGASGSAIYQKGVAATTGDGGTNGIVTALRVGYAYTGSNAYANLDLAQLRIYPGPMSQATFDAIASQML